MLGAELSEVWDDYKSKKEKKKKKDKNENDKSVLINERDRLTSLINDRDINYRYQRVNPNSVTFENPYDYVGTNLKENIVRPSRIEDDPDYKEFLEFKKNKNSSKRDVIIKQENNQSNRQGDNRNDEQLNELILYIFTGFFLLVLYDNIYKLGKQSY